MNINDVILIKGNKNKKKIFNIVSLGSLIWIVVAFVMYFGGLFERIPNNHGNVFFIAIVFAYIISFCIAIQRNIVIIYEKGIVPSWFISLNIMRRYIPYDSIEKIIIDRVNKTYNVKIVLKDNHQAKIDNRDFTISEWNEVISLIKHKSKEYNFKVDFNNFIVQ